MISSAQDQTSEVREVHDFLDVVSEIARRLDARQQDITRNMTQLLAREIPELNADQRLVELLDASVEGNVKTLFHVLANHIPIDHLQPTTAAVEYALRLAQREIPANALARAYHMGQDDFMDAVFSEAQHLECRAELKLKALHHISDVAYRYIDWISLYVIDVHEKERRRWISTRANVHAALIHKILARQPVSTNTFETETGYPLGRNHVALVVWSVKNNVEPDEHRKLEQFIRKIVAQCGGAGQPLITAVDRATAWAWIPLRKKQQFDIETVRQLTAVTGECRVAVGLPSFGRAGFIRSHEQAQAARQVALAAAQRGPAVVSFGDEGVAIVSLLAKDVDATARWVDEVLGPLAINNDNAHVLRETLGTYFAVGENYAKTAELLNLHRNTVKYRVSKALGKHTGYHGGDRIDLALALQVCKFLGSQVLRAPTSDDRSHPAQG